MIGFYLFTRHKETAKEKVAQLLETNATAVTQNREQKATHSKELKKQIDIHNAILMDIFNGKKRIMGVTRGRPRIVDVDDQVEEPKAGDPAAISSGFLGLLLYQYFFLAFPSPEFLVIRKNS